MKLIIDAQKDVCPNKKTRRDIFEDQSPQMWKRSISTDSDMDMDATIEYDYIMYDDTSVDGYISSTTLDLVETGFDSARSSQYIEDRTYQLMKNNDVLQE
jgi:hypothetical protein